MRKIRMLISGIVAALLLSFAVLAVWSWVSAARHGEVELKSITFSPEENIAPGTPVTVTAQLLIPWGQTLQRMELTPAAGVVSSGKPAAHFAGVTRRGRRMTVKTVLKAYRTGPLSGGVLKLTVERAYFADGARFIEIPVKLPDLRVAAPEIAGKTDLPLADALTPPAAGKRLRPGTFAAAGTALFLLLAAAIWLLLRRSRRKPACRTPWEIAAEALAALRSEAASGKRPVGWYVARLTDVVRDYLSVRFQLPVSRQTTGEFLHSLKRPDSPLSAEQGRNLADFLNAADLVKFAGQTPERGYLENAIGRAELLVAETRPPAAAQAGDGGMGKEK